MFLLQNHHSILQVLLQIYGFRMTNFHWFSFISVNLWIGNPNRELRSFIPNSYFEVAAVSRMLTVFILL